MSKIINKNLIKALFLGSIFIFVTIFFIPKSSFAATGYLNQTGYVGYAGSSSNSGSSSTSSSNTSNYPYNNYNYYGNTNNSGLTDLKPNITSLHAGYDKKILIIKGENFVPGSVVKVDNSYRSTTFLDANTLAVNLNDNDVIGTGTHLIQVQNPAPNGKLLESGIKLFPEIYTPVKTTTTPAKVATNTKTTAKKTTPNGYANTNTTGNTNNKTSTSLTENISNKITSVKESFTSTDKKTGEVKDNSVVGKITTKKTSSQVASAGSASNSFLPNTILAWLLTLLVIFLIILVSRRLITMGRDKKEYLHLKHA